MARPLAGQIVIVDWRRLGRQPDEPGGLRPAVVVESSVVFAGGSYRNVLVVPMTTDARFGEMADLVERIEPTPENGATQTCWAVAHHVGSVPISRVRPTNSRITDAQLQGVRDKIALAVGFEPVALGQGSRGA